MNFRNNSSRVLYICSAFFLFILCLSGCAARGPVVVRTYEENFERNQIAVLKLEQKMSLTVRACDGLGVPRSARYLLLQPGRHELIFSINGQTLATAYKMSGKKYLEAVAGHTYILKSTTGWFSVGDKWYPEVIDVTDDSTLHVNNLPLEEAQSHD